MVFLALACAPSPTDADPVDSPADSDVATDHTDDADDSDDSDPVDTGEPLEADLLFDGREPPSPILGVGGQIWAGDTGWTAALDPLGARVVRVALNANLGSSAVTLPVDASAAEWDAWMDAHVLDEAPSFATDLHASLALTEARGISWIAHVWEAPPAWESGGVLRPDRVDDQAAMIDALVGWLGRQGIEPRWLELSNEPDGDWNTYIPPEDYDDLVVATRAALDARGLDRIGIVGPGLAVLGGWTDPPAWVPSLSPEAVDALDAWSVHTWDDYAEAGRGHAFLEERWEIFTDQVNAADPSKPILVTEMGSKDTVFGAASYGSPDAGACGAASESDDYAIRLLAHTAIALNRGADAISYWQAADQSWECSRWGMVDTAGRSRRFLDALRQFTAALPVDGGTVSPVAADLPAVAVLGATAGAVLVVNDGDTRVTRTVGVRGDWRLVESRGFATHDRVLRDELYDLGQASSADADLAIDTGNVGYFASDHHRAYRTADHDAALVWTPGGALDAAEVVAWSWNGAEPVAVSVESATDGLTWTPAAVAETVGEPGWHRHRLTITSFPPDTRSLRVTLPATGAPAWTPQLGDVTIAWRPDDPPTLPSGAGPWTVDLPPGSAVVLVVAR